ncbi:MAG: hypothetical protein ABW168_09035 [Sedimenticola sp.]
MTEHAVDDYATIDEAVAALEQLTAEDMIRLEKVARYRVSGLPHVEWRDLFQTSVERVIAGTRQWPRGVGFVVFLSGVMKSVTNEHWKHLGRAKKAGVIMEFSPRVSEATGRVASDNPGQDSELAAQQELERVESLFENDEHALAIIMSKAEGYSPAEAQEMFGMTAKEYSTAMKRVRRKLLRKKKIEGEQ